MLGRLSMPVGESEMDGAISFWDRIRDDQVASGDQACSKQTREAHLAGDKAEHVAQTFSFLFS
jgi:hypothetical protein